VCAERGIARQVRMVAARHGFSRGRLSTVVISLAFRLDESPKPSLQTSRLRCNKAESVSGRARFESPWRYY
jgi:hypothetical protein